MNRLEDAEKRFTAALRLMRLAEAEDIKEADGASAGPRCDSFLNLLVVPTPHQQLEFEKRPPLCKHLLPG
jgi:hypothetical protein